MIRITCETLHTLALEELTEFQGGLKIRGESDIEKIRKSITDYGFATPFFIWRNDATNYVLDGHGRVKALQAMQHAGEIIPPLPVVYVDCKDESAARNLLLRINSTYGLMTADTVRDFIKDLSIAIEDIRLPCGTIDLSFMQEEADTKDDDKAPAAIMDTPPISKTGEIYELGWHRLICGDSTEDDILSAVMGDSKADLILTDPPYNVDYAGKTDEKLKIDNDKKDSAAFTDFLTKAFVSMFATAKAGAAFYIFYAQVNSDLFINALKNAGYKPHQYLVWVKNIFTLSFADYKWKHEPIMYGWKDGASHNFYGALNLSTVFDKKKDIEKMSKEELKTELKRIANSIPQDIIYEKKPPRNTEHPTMKPVELLTTFIKNSTKSEDIVLDPFGGSGTTLIAAAKTGRTARLVESDPHYCDVIRRRWTKWAKDNGYAVGSGGLE
nr:MAG TPA: adenine specific DNA methyltransferase [Caudoviricetes sp.]